MSAHWQRELRAFETFLDRRSTANYRDWQPAKWQSLSGIVDRLIEHCLPRSGATALELGCGSATLLIQLAMRGVNAVALDRNADALRLAERAATSMAVEHGLQLRAGDFTDPSIVDGLAPADLVLHIGVIEHFDVAEQLEFLRLSASLSHRWVLVGIPNTDSPVFRSFLTTMQRQGRVYEDEHLDIDVPALAEKLGYRVEIMDGAHLFLGEQELYNAGDSELDEFYLGLGTRLVEVGGSRYERFPNLDFHADDVPVMRQVESERTAAERLRFGFLNYYLLDCAA